MNWISRHLSPRGRRIRRIAAGLPGANCGACGFTSCRGYAASIHDTREPADRCPLCDRVMYAAIADMIRGE